MVKFVVVCSQFYQHFTSSFCTNLPKNNKKQIVNIKKLCKRLSYQKAPWKCWYNLHLGVNFTIMFTQSFYTYRSQKCKKDWRLVCIFCAFLICEHKMLEKLTPGVNFTNMFTKRSYGSRSQKHKNDSQVINSFCPFGICERKSCF